MNVAVKQRCVRLNYQQHSKHDTDPWPSGQNDRHHRSTVPERPCKELSCPRQALSGKVGNSHRRNKTVSELVSGLTGRRMVYFAGQPVWPRGKALGW